MLMTEPTPVMVEEWKIIFAQYKNRLRPNKKSAEEVITYLRKKYPISEIKEREAKEVVRGNIMLNAYYANKVPVGEVLRVQVFAVEHSGAGNTLYEQQDTIFRGKPIMVGLEFATSFLMVSGSSLLHDELVAFQGLDATDLTNFYLVAEYVACLKRFNMLSSVLT